MNTDDLNKESQLNEDKKKERRKFKLGNKDRELSDTACGVLFALAIASFLVMLAWPPFAIPCIILFVILFIFG